MRVNKKLITLRERYVNFFPEAVIDDSWGFLISGR